MELFIKRRIATSFLAIAVLLAGDRLADADGGQCRVGHCCPRQCGREADRPAKEDGSDRGAGLAPWRPADSGLSARAAG